MLKKCLPILLLALGTGASGEQIPDLREYKNANETFDPSPVFTESFDAPLEGWARPAKFKVAKDEGVNGTSALFYDRADPKEYLFFSKSIKLDSRLDYECSFMFRTEDINFRDTDQNAFKDQVSIMGIQYRENGKWVAISPSEAKHKNLGPGEWQAAKFPVRQPNGENMTASFDIYLRSGVTGKMWIDDIVVRPVGMTSAIIHPVASALRLDDAGRVSIRADLIGAENSPALALLVDAGGRKKLLRGKDGLYEGDFGKFPPGDIKVEAKLLDTGKKLVMATDSILYFSSDIPKPEGAAVLDPAGRLMVDGRPYMPVAIFSGFTYPTTVEDLVRFKEAGFNSLMYYHPIKYLWITGKKGSQRENVLSSLDEMRRHDMKLIFSVFRQNIPGQVGAFDTFDDVKGVDKVTEHVVELVRSHPAILAYYLSDENPLKEYPTIKALRERVSRKDPWHPTVTLTCRADFLTQCSQTGDIVSYDYYPVNTEKDKSFSYEELRKAGGLGAPHWFTPQAFNWGIHRRHHKYESYRYPTEEEMRSMNLAAVIFNAKGFMFYSYPSIRDQEKLDQSPASLSFWDSVANVARTLRSLEPWIMSVEPAPEVRVSQTHSGKARVIARAFTSGGKTCVVVVSNGPDEASAEIVVPGRPGLKSKYGRVEDLGGGKYAFKARDIASDILLQ